jgi:hypothetical protein
LNNLTVTEYKDIRVLTTQQLADQYETNEKVISNNFNRNKERYQEGKHYISLEGEEKREFLNHHQIEDGLKNATKVYLWTEKGCLLHAKSIGTDKAWEVYEELVDTYFKAKDIFAGLTEEMKVLLSHDKKIQAVICHMEKQDIILDKLENEVPLFNIECDELQSLVKKVGTRCLGGYNSPAYKDNSLRTKVYKDIQNQLKREFGLERSYKALKRKQFDKAKEIIEAYELPFILAEEVMNANNQLSLV